MKNKLFIVSSIILINIEFENQFNIALAMRNPNLETSRETDNKILINQLRKEIDKKDQASIYNITNISLKYLTLNNIPKDVSKYFLHYHETHSFKAISGMNFTDLCQAITEDQTQVSLEPYNETVRRYAPHKIDQNESVLLIYTLCCQLIHIKYAICDKSQITLRRLDGKTQRDFIVKGGSFNFELSDDPSTYSKYRQCVTDALCHIRP